jgi:hypothetical protein
MNTFPPELIDDDHSAVVRRASNEKCARPKAAVLADLACGSGEIKLASRKPVSQRQPSKAAVLG